MDGNREPSRRLAAIVKKFQDSGVKFQLVTPPRSMGNVQSKTETDPRGCEIRSKCSGRKR